MSGVTKVYHCFRWIPQHGYIGDCLTTTSVAEIDAHTKLVCEMPAYAKEHLLNINYYNESGEWIRQQGMRLPDAVINVEAGTVQHFLDAYPPAKERKG